jgi:hypothetical protein
MYASGISNPTVANVRQSVPAQVVDATGPLGSIGRKP